jgi:RIO-like serine/threonine protein kinase
LDFLLRVTIFPAGAKRSQNYEYTYNVQKDLKMTNGFKNEFDVHIPETIEWKENYAITLPVDGMPLSLLWQRGEKARLLKLYSKVFKAVWKSLLEFGYLLDNLMPYEILVDENEKLTLMNLDRTIKIQNDNHEEILQVAMNLTKISENDQEFLSRTLQSIKWPHIKSFIEIQLHVLQLLDEKATSSELKDFLIADSKQLTQEFKAS